MQKLSVHAKSQPRPDGAEGSPALPAISLLLLPLVLPFASLRLAGKGLFSNILSPFVLFAVVAACCTATAYRALCVGYLRGAPRRQSYWPGVLTTGAGFLLSAIILVAFSAPAHWLRIQTQGRVFLALAWAGEAPVYAVLGLMFTLRSRSETRPNGLLIAMAILAGLVCLFSLLLMVGMLLM